MKGFTRSLAILLLGVSLLLVPSSPAFCKEKSPESRPKAAAIKYELLTRKLLARMLRH